MLNYLVNYLVRPHQKEDDILQMRPWSLGTLSVRVKLVLSWWIRWRRFLNTVTVVAETVSSFSSFQQLTTLWKKKYFLKSRRFLCFFSFNEYPLVLLSVDGSNINSILIPDRPECYVMLDINVTTELIWSFMDLRYVANTEIRTILAVQQSSQWRRGRRNCLLVNEWVSISDDRTRWMLLVS